MRVTCLLVVLLLATGCTTVSTLQIGKCSRIPSEYHNAYVHEKQIILTYTERIQSEDYVTQGDAPAWLGIPISVLRDEVGRYTDIPKSCYHRGKLPCDIQSAAQEIPLVTGVDETDAKAALTNTAYAVIVMKHFPGLCIRFTNDKGGRGLERTGWSGVGGRHAWSYPVIVAVLPLAVCVDIVTAPIQILAFWGGKEFDRMIRD